MCDIAGIVIDSNRDTKSYHRDVIELMIAATIIAFPATVDYRNEDYGICLGHRRLAIIDLNSRSNQPFKIIPTDMVSSGLFRL